MRRNLCVKQKARTTLLIFRVVGLNRNNILGQFHFDDGIEILLVQGELNLRQLGVHLLVCIPDFAVIVVPVDELRLAIAEGKDSAA